jgi:1-acyl-sn-glycerol-3-phosphate acyltransferase
MTTSAIDTPIPAPATPAEPVPLTYRFSKAFGQFTFLCTMNTHVLHPEIPERTGPFILAVTHLSHIEPLCTSVLVRRKIDWMTRKEFYTWRICDAYLRAIDAIKVNRQGIPVAAVRTAIERLRMGRVLGICPEGGVVHGTEAAIRGGPIKRGVCSAAIRAGVPIVPCVILGTHKLNKVGPWLPFKHATIWVSYGPPIHPPAGIRSTRATRHALADQLVRAYQDLYVELRGTYNIADSEIP